MAAGVPKASFENPTYTGPRSLNRTSPLGGVNMDLVPRDKRVLAIEVLESQPVAGGGDGIMNLRYWVNNKGTQIVRPYTNPTFLGTVSARVNAITKAGTYQQVQQD